LTDPDRVFERIDPVTGEVASRTRAMASAEAAAIAEKAAR